MRGALPTPFTYITTDNGRGSRLFRLRPPHRQPLCFSGRSAFTRTLIALDSEPPAMRLSRYFLPILRETPKEAEIISHRLMLRAGMMRQEAAGIYAFLPLGLRVLKK